MLVKIGGRKVDVLDERCTDRPCFSLFFDKGAFSQGRGYTGYHTDAKGRRVERPVCGTRHLRGCPVESVCPECRYACVDGPGSACGRWQCAGVTIARAEEVSRGAK